MQEAGAYLPNGLVLPGSARIDLSRPDQVDVFAIAAGSPLLVPVPDGHVSVLVYGTWIFATSAAAGTRYPFVSCQDNDGMEMWRAPAPAGIAAGLTTTLSLQISGGSGIAVGSTQIVGLPTSGCWPGMSYRFDATGLQAADQTMEVHFHRVLIPLGPALEPTLVPPVAPIRLR